MSLFVISDLHLSLSSQKPMDVFPGWKNYVEILANFWRKSVGPEDTVVVPGDISWGMTLEESLGDFRFIDLLPGRKIILKGNHDYFFTSATKLKNFFAQHQITTIDLLHNNAFLVENIALCGTRGWTIPQGEQPQGAEDEKILAREVGRLKASLERRDPSAAETVVFFHYPPLSCQYAYEPVIELLKEYGVRRCYYGHIHGPGQKYAFEGNYRGIDFTLVSCDKLLFRPLKIG